jgi:hypothetical protein
MAINLPTSFIARHSKMCPNLDFWFENNHLATLVHVTRFRDVIQQIVTIFNRIITQLFC